ncbi:MAG: hypothetical protein RSF02_00920 [Bacilli bacterium]
MIVYPKNPIYPRPLNYNGDRFIFPFLVGALAGGAAIGLTRPRPIYNVAPQNQYYPPYYNPAMPYYNNNYSYYVPYR